MASPKSMASNKSMLDQILEVQRELKKQNCFAPPKFPPLPKPTPEELLPDQEEMDKLASALTEAVLQLRAGDMEGARTTLNDANGLCGVRLSAHAVEVPDHYLDALRYGIRVPHYQPPHQPEVPPTVTEQLMRQQIAEQRMRQLMEEMNKNVGSTLHPPRILSDNTDDPTDPGV